MAPPKFPKNSSQPDLVGEYSGRKPQCHLPIIAVVYPAPPRSEASVGWVGSRPTVDFSMIGSSNPASVRPG